MLKHPKCYRANHCSNSTYFLFPFKPLSFQTRPPSFFWLFQCLFSRSKCHMRIWVTGSSGGDDDGGSVLLWIAFSLATQLWGQLLDRNWCIFCGSLILVGDCWFWVGLILAMGCYGGGSLILGWVDVVVGWLILNFRFYWIMGS